MSLDDLSGDIGDEGFLLDLDQSCQAVRYQNLELEIAYLVNGNQAVQSLLTAEVLHVRMTRLAPISNSRADDGLSRRIIPTFGSDILWDMLLQLFLDTLLTLLIDRLGVVVIVVDRKALAVSEKLVQLVKRSSAVLFEGWENR